MTRRILRAAGCALAALLLHSAAPQAQHELTGGTQWGPLVQEASRALALTGDPRAGKARYGVCAACHRPTAWGDPAGTLPQLAGQHATVLIKQIADMRASQRDNPAMYPFAILIEGPQELADLAAYIGTLPMNPMNPQGPGTDVGYGKALFEDTCARCHGPSGEGSLAAAIPLIGGQTYAYIVRQLKEIRDGKRRNANPDMVKQVIGFSDRDFLAVADYVSRLRTPSHGRNLEPLSK